MRRKGDVIIIIEDLSKKERLLLFLLNIYEWLSPPDEYEISYLRTRFAPWNKGKRYSWLSIAGEVFAKVYCTVVMFTATLFLIMLAVFICLKAYDPY